MKSLKAKFRKTDVNEWNKNDERLLAAVEHGEVEKVASLLGKKGISAVKLDGEGKSALHVAAARGQTDCLALILSHGADLSLLDAAGLNPLHLAAKHNQTECCKKLIQNKCPIDGVDTSGKTAMHHAAAGGNIQTVQLLCELKCALNLKDADGFTPLLLAAKHAHAEVCSSLLDRGAEINTCDNSGRTALTLASEFKSARVAELLLHRGAHPSAGDPEAKGTPGGAPSRQHAADSKSPKSPQHDQVAKLSDERITTPKKRKAPPPPNSPLQRSGASSPSSVASPGTVASDKRETPKRFNYKEDETGGTRGEKLHEERSMLLETIEDVKPTVTAPEPETKAEQTAAVVSALQAKITALTLENQTLASKLKKHPSLQGNEDLREDSRPNSMASNASFHSTQDQFESQAVQEEEESEGGSSAEEIRLLRQALESVQVKLLETRKENRSLQAQLKPDRAEGEEEAAAVREKGREAELMESLAELQAKLTDTQERYHQALEEAEELRAPTGNSSVPEQLKAQLVRAAAEQDEAARRIAELEEELRRTEEERESGKEREQWSAKVEGLYKEAREEIRMLQEALRGTVPVEAAAKDFEEMKAEMNEVIAGLQRRLLELSHSYSETNNKLSATQKELEGVRAESAAASSPAAADQQQVQALGGRVEELQTQLADAETKHAAAREEIEALKREAEEQAQSTVALADHTQVMMSLGNAIKELESQSDALKEQLQQKSLQVEALHNRLASEKDVAPDDSVSRLDHEALREQLEGQVSHLTQLLQGALRKQDEMALEAADAWQTARDNGAEREALQELLVSREKENLTLTSRLAEAQDAVCQLKQLVENHVASEREKNKRIDDLSREVNKLKEALNSLSQLSYSAGSPSKRQQQSQQLDTLQQQIKQLQYQLAESKKQHHEVVSVYRMHLLYAVQGQMDEDVQKALKQILMMCKMPSPTKESC